MSLKIKILPLLTLVLVLFSGFAAAVEIPASNLFMPRHLEDARLFHDKDGFTLVQDGEEISVKAENIGKDLQGLSDEDLDFLLGLKAKFNLGGHKETLSIISPEEGALLIMDNPELIWNCREYSKEIISQLPASSYITVFKYSDGEYGLHLSTRLLGGKPFGGHKIWAKIGNAVFAVTKKVLIVIVQKKVEKKAGEGAGEVVAAILEAGVDLATGDLKPEKQADPGQSSTGSTPKEPVAKNAK